MYVLDAKLLMLGMFFHVKFDCKLEHICELQIKEYV